MGFESLENLLIKSKLGINLSWALNRLCNQKKTLSKFGMKFVNFGSIVLIKLSFRSDK